MPVLKPVPVAGPAGLWHVGLRFCQGAVPSKVITLFSYFRIGTKTMLELPEHVAKLSLARRVLSPGCVSLEHLAAVSSSSPPPQCWAGRDTLARLPAMGWPCRALGSRQG